MPKENDLIEAVIRSLEAAPEQWERGFLGRLVHEGAGIMVDADGPSVLLRRGPVYHEVRPDWKTPMWGYRARLRGAANKALLLDKGAETNSIDRAIEVLTA